MDTDALLSNGIAYGGIVLVVVFMILSLGFVLSRFYRRCGADEALVRTGSGGNKVVIGGGVLVYPILHQLQRVSLRSVKLSVERAGKNALVTADKIKANVTTELYIKVEPVAEDVLAAARSFGDRNMDEHAIGDLIEGKLTDALRSVSANQSFMSLHGRRKEFAENIQAALAEELKKNGLTLENVSITGLAMLPVKELDAQDVFDAEGLRAITESVQANREKTNRVQRETEITIQKQNVESRLQALMLEQQQKHAEADQSRKVAEYSAVQAAETAKAAYIQDQSRELGALEKQRALEIGRISQEQIIAVATADRMRAEQEAKIAAEKGRMSAEIDKQRAIEAATIAKQKVVQAAEIERQQALEAATVQKEKVVGAALIEKEQAIEVARIGKQIAVTRSQEEAARAAAAKGLAEADHERATQAITTVEVTAKAERERAVQVIAAQASAEMATIAADAKGQAALKEAEGRAQALRTEAEGRALAALKEAEAIMTLATAEARRGEVAATNRRLQIEAENAQSMKFVARDIMIKALEVMPEVTRELMAPAKAITEIKVLQMGNNGGANSGPLGSVASPLIKTLMEAGSAYPLMRELVDFARNDPRISSKAEEVLGSLGKELEQALQDPAAPATEEKAS